MDLQTVTSTDVQRGFAKILNNLTEPVLVMRDSRPAAVVVDYKEYLRMKQAQRKERAETFLKMLDEVHAQNAHIPAAEVDRDVAAAIKYVRSHR